MRAALAVALLLAACTHSDPKPDPKPTDDGAGGGEKKPLMAGLLIPPPVGETRTTVDGCAAKPDEEPPASRAALPDEKVVATPTGGGFVLSHDVPHACCLKAKTAVDVQGDKVVITDTFEGTACRCRCSSTIKTAVGLKPGAYTVEVKTVEPNAAARSAWSGPVTVP